MSRKHPFSDFSDEGVKPLGRKQPLAFLAPTLRLMAPGSSIVVPKFPPKRILSIARRAGIPIRLEADPTSIRVIRLPAPRTSPTTPGKQK